MPQTVLLVDDDTDLHVLVKNTLARHGYVVAEAYDGAEALSMLSRVKPDILLVDLTMPGMDGWTFIREYRSLTHANTPVVVLTARTGFLDKTVMSKLNDVDAYLTKPFEPKELRMIVQELLARRGVK
ncbi:MAG: hypothetical protein AUJ92_10355 [Armatimonadetes bacterium CG2_30_59_28]|nr:response regulator [Armatimonadota bacterium]OIO94295.1 MAG: hypothetical protein AUJ92_10355 [Armatimonadetes bacterium CG2_30_59_28]PIU65470.1 MAG: DNA-binding response regulator [Armatimonadetes bacterium CG07_land_8_20_14_0_80_59_28]PIX42125.1 MAG: DNA-binding response regulator [Armatimonadetes bacterium CG_4_8_14_3_um_filter_58_9]PIY47146.1 MAG: DNA-binding response regulator [Armatimonadetes bacterium CG_4_10_14_3_um_filter_59_10]PJB65205.1 MAG: DNA-binding response regulator [Armati